MNALRLMTAAVCLSPLVMMAQTGLTETTPDPVLDAIREFNSRPPAKGNEVTVVLEPPAEQAVAKEATTPPKESKPPVKEAWQPLVVTGDSHENVTSAPEQDGLSVDVEKLQHGKGVIQSGEIKLLAPFPAKAISSPPTGWKLDAQADVPPLKKEIELNPGQKITLTIRPHLLVPEADGTTSFSVSETGYDPALGYKQKETVGAILSRSIRQLEDDSKDLGTAIDNLQQLLVSLPTPEPPAPAAPPATPPAKR